MNNILDNVWFNDSLENYFNNKNNYNIHTDNNTVYNSNSNLLKEIHNDINFVDDYFGDSKIHNLENVKFRIENQSMMPWSKFQMALDKNNKIINISNKMLSYFTILNYISLSSSFIKQCRDIIVNDDDVITIEEEVFLFFDCFPFAPVHNLDDTYNLLYEYKKNNLKSKLLVIKTDNFYYNQTLESLRKYFNLEYVYLDINKTYHFEKFKCVRQYHFLQKEASKYIKQNYIQKILDNYVAFPAIENISIIKTSHPTNCSEVDTFQITDSFKSFANNKNIFDTNILRENLEHKIYIINSAKNILVSYLSPFMVNIYNHTIDTENKNFLILNGRSVGSINNQFLRVGNNKYNIYNSVINGMVIDEKISLDKIEEINNLYKIF